FCSQAIWMDRGQIVRQGDALEVVKEYERYLRLLEERRLKADNARRKAVPVGGAELEGEAHYTDALVGRVRAPAGARLRVGEVVLLENDRAQDRLHIGGPQDSEVQGAAVLRRETLAAWSPPHITDGRMYRELTDACGEAAFSLYLFDPSVTYA